ncbi:MAG: ATP-binding protein [Syntrophobacter sp.]
MRSLFFKIFLWFWLAMTLMVAVFLVLGIATESVPAFIGGWSQFSGENIKEGNKISDIPSFANRWQRLAAGTLWIFGQTAAEIFEREGPIALVHYAEQVELATRIHLYFLNDGTDEASGEPVPEEVARLAAGVLETGESEFVRHRQLLVAHPISGPSNRQYVIVGESFDRRIDLIGFNRLVMHLVAFLITAGVVCYGLARYITSPMEKLREATHRIAGGDLVTRVGGALGRRKDEIAELAGSFDMMASRIDSLVSAQRRLLRDISHELRSPLARLVIALELARKRANPEAQGYLDRIERESGRLNELIEQLLVLARWESGADQANFAPIDVVELLEEVAGDAEFEVRNRNCTVRVYYDERYVVSGMVELLRSAFENIVRNAVYYTREGTEVAVSVNPEKEGIKSMVAIEVRDHGPGVPDLALTELFRPFYRVSESRDRKGGGVGLGLTIAERAVRLHGGSVSAANAPGGGLLIRISLPTA